VAISTSQLVRTFQITLLSAGIFFKVVAFLDRFLPIFWQEYAMANQFFVWVAQSQGSTVSIAFLVAGILLFNKKLAFGWTICFATAICNTLFYCSGIFILLKSSIQVWATLNILLMLTSFCYLLLLLDVKLRKQFEVTNKNYLLGLLLGFVILVLQYYSPI
jgi:hypothetical protein